MSRPLIAILLLATSIAAAHAFGLGLGNRFGRLGANGGSVVVAPPPIGGALMIEDGTSFLLLEDGSSHLCLEGGC